MIDCAQIDERLFAVAPANPTPRRRSGSRLTMHSVQMEEKTGLVTHARSQQSQHWLHPHVHTAGVVRHVPGVVNGSAGASDDAAFHWLDKASDA